MKRYLISITTRAIHDPLYNPVSGSTKLAIIFGWGGSEPKNFKKLISMYESRGISTLLHTMPVFCFEPTREYYEEKIIRLVIAAKEVEKCGSKLFIHIFSNNGSWEYASLLKKGMLSNPTKIIFDSAPYFHYQQTRIGEDASAISRVLTSVILRKAQYYSFPLSPFLYGIVYVSVVITRLAEYLQGSNRIVTDIIGLNKFLRDNLPKVPVCFIHSSGDGLIPVDVVAKFKDDLEARGIRCEQHVFGDEVMHTSAFFKHPDRYTQILQRFLEIDSAKSKASAEQR